MTINKVKNRYEWKEIRKHNSVNDCWVVYNGNVYDITSFVPHHPGGPYTLSTAAGQDITYLMHTSHPLVNYPFELLKKYQIGTVTKDFVTYNVNEQPFYTEITEKVRQYFKQNPQLDSKDASFTFKVFFGILFFYLLGFYYFFTSASYWSVILIGITRSLFGIHTMHACSHFSVTHNPLVWKYLNWFCFDILMGSSHWAWDYQHVIGHHQHTNVFQADPDLPIIHQGDMRYIVEKGQQWKSLYKYQHIYLPFLYLFLAIKVHIYDMMYLFGYQMNGNIHMNQNNKKYISLLLTKLFWYFYNFYVPIVWFNISIIQFIKLFLVMEIASGGYLAYVFQVNHISEHVQYTDKDDKNSTTKKEWAILQVEGSVDYGHNSMFHILATGTLNYQIIHHLFPSIAPHHYPAIAPLVQESCKKFHVKYQCHKNYFYAAKAHYNELKRMGQLGIQAHFDADGLIAH